MASVGQWLLLDSGFTLTGFKDWALSIEGGAEHPEWMDERHRPYFLLICRRKKINICTLASHTILRTIAKYPRRVTIACHVIDLTFAAFTLSQTSATC
ncbi:unnamed protein product [Penicillium camemberti]|uniref:Str. FM013 n=1 Tax=Penicillium camemberti (strain FM 013) TaxID=1429867 RepID=A0A0G4PGJ9_PENC3|nr:unnamed protein product [Penicillium camemberti]